MKVLLELKNRNSDFIAGAFLELPYWKYNKDTLDDILSEALMEYDWDEDQSKRNALEILTSTLYSAYADLCLDEDRFGTENNEIPGLVLKYNSQKDFLVEKMLNLNLYKELDFGESSCIFLNENWLVSAESMCDEIITRAYSSVDERLY